MFSENGGGGPPTAGILVRGPDPSRVATLHAIRRTPELPLEPAIPGLVRALRAVRWRGGIRLPLLAAPLTATGDAVLAAVHEWEITDLDCDR